MTRTGANSPCNSLVSKRTCGAAASADHVLPDLEGLLPETAFRSSPHGSCVRVHRGRHLGVRASIAHQLVGAHCLQGSNNKMSRVDIATCGCFHLRLIQTSQRLPNTSGRPLKQKKGQRRKDPNSNLRSTAYKDRAGTEAHSTSWVSTFQYSLGIKAYLHCVALAGADLNECCCHPAVRLAAVSNSVQPDLQQNGVCVRKSYPTCLRQTTTSSRN